MDNPALPTGYASTCRLTAKQLAKRGHEVYAVAFNGGDPQPNQGIVDWYGLKIIPNFGLERNRNAIYGDAQTILEIEKRVSPDIYFFHNDSYRYSYLRDVPKEILERSVFWLPFEGEQQDMMGVQLFNMCAATRFVTKHALNVHATALKGKDIGYIPHAIDLESLSPCPDKVAAKAKHIQPRLGRDASKTFVVVRIDRHQPRKYWDLTLRAFAKFAEGKDDVAMLCKCNPRDITMWNAEKKSGIDLEAMVKDMGLSGKVFFDDFFFHTKAMAESFYHPADVFLTTTSGEGFGLTSCESMACGLPVIYPMAPVLPEVIGDAGIPFKIKEKAWYEPMKVWHHMSDTDDAAAKLEGMYQDWKSGGKMIAEIGAKARKKAEETYGPEPVYDAWDKLFHSVAKQRRMATLITVIYNLKGQDQLTGDDGVDKLRETIEKHVHYPYEWIIIDNGSPCRDETREWMKKAAGGNQNVVPIYLDINMGYAAANNVGIAAAKGKHVLLVNPDSEALDPAKLGLPADFVQMLVEKAASDPSIGLVGMEMKRRDDITPGLTFPYFGCVLITRPCLDACKISEDRWLDEAFWPAYYEDAQFTLRAAGKGFKAVEHNVPFWHKSGGTNKHAIEGGKDGGAVKYLMDALDRLSKDKPSMADWGRKRGELLTGGMQGLIGGNIAFLNQQYGMEARTKIKIVIETHIGAGVGFSEIAQWMAPALQKMGFDVYVNDWSNGGNVEDPLIAQFISKYRTANEKDELDGAIHIVCWLMETFLNVDADYKVGIAFCESTKVRESYLQACNGMDRILTFSNFCRKVQKDSGFQVPIDVAPPAVNPEYVRCIDREIKNKFTFLAVGVAQERKDTRRMVQAFCEAFPKGVKKPPECEDGFPLTCDQVELVIKSNNFGELDWVHKEGFSNNGNIKTIFTGWDGRASRKDLTTKEMVDLYAAADCLVHPSHGEGIGMPICEFAATGGPVIFTNWSSPSEYFDESNSYPCSLSPYPGTTLTQAYPGAPGDNGQWANVHIGHLKHLMYHVIRNREEAREKGRRAHEKVKKCFTPDEAVRHLVPLVFEWDAERKKKQARTVFDPMTFEKPKLEPIRKGDRVMLDICSRDRQPYLCTLLGTLLMQSFKDWDIIIQCDDSDESMPNNPLIMSLMNRFHSEGHGWSIIRSHRQGPHIAHDRTLQMTTGRPYKYKLICRVDDDLILRPDFLEKLYGQFLADEKAEIGAVAGVLLDPNRPESQQVAPKGWESDINYAGKIGHNVPWPYVCRYPDGTKPREVEHLYSSYMYRVEVANAIGGYCRKFSPIGHREESDFSYRFFLGGFRLLVHPDAIGFHFSAPSGGIRSQSIQDRQKLAESDHKIYEARLRKWRRRAETRKQADAEKAKTQPKAPEAVPQPVAQPTIFDSIKKGKVAAILSCGADPAATKVAVGKLSPMVDEIYVTSQHEATRAALAGTDHITMTAIGEEESATLLRALISEGDHEYIMTVADNMAFKSNPVGLLCDRFDDYVFEVFMTYRAGHDASGKFVSDDKATIVVGPEVRNECLITRRRPGAKPSLDRTYYSDIPVIQDEQLAQTGGKSILGNPLIPLADLDSKPYIKVCTYQYPEGRLSPPRSLDVKGKEALVSIIIPTPGRRVLLKKCIDSIFAYTSTPFEVIVVDNASSDGTAEMLADEAKARPNVVVIRSGVNLGYQKAVNLAVSKSRGKYLLLFNDDAWLEGPEPEGRDWLRTYMDELDKNPKLGIVGPHAGKSPALGIDMLYFWCVMIRRETWDEVGPLDDVTFVNYGGDDDYIMRLRAKGYEIGQKLTRLRHLMNCVPDNVKNPQLEQSRIKLKAKYGRLE
jgi:GT2 family glycosyltransferase/glycosyltransferase involved in cell wall biosynthesis